MIEDTIADAKRRMGKSIDSLGQELGKVRTGRANPALLSHIRVEYYGAQVPLNNTANITVEDARTLVITAYEKDMTAVIEKALLASDLGITPNTAGAVIRIPLPPLTEERRRELVKMVKQEAENGKIAIRNIRRDANSDLKEMVKEKMISEDDEHRAMDRVQKLTDESSHAIDALVAKKEKELMDI